MKILPRLLPLNSPKRQGLLIPQSITIHETSLGTDLQPATKDYGRYYNMLLTTDSSIGYHFLVEANNGEETRIYQFLETNVATKHTGNPTGNNQSIGIERLVNVNTDMERAIDAQAILTATLMHMFSLTLDDVLPHRYWSGKECPARLLAGMYGGWDGFIDRVAYHFVKRSWVEGVL